MFEDLLGAFGDWISGGGGDMADAFSAQDAAFDWSTAPVWGSVSDTGSSIPDVVNISPDISSTIDFGSSVPAAGEVLSGIANADIPVNLSSASVPFDWSVPVSNGTDYLGQATGYLSNAGDAVSNAWDKASLPTKLVGGLFAAKALDSMLSPSSTVSSIASSQGGSANHGSNWNSPLPSYGYGRDPITGAVIANRTPVAPKTYAEQIRAGFVPEAAAFVEKYRQPVAMKKGGLAAVHGGQDDVVPAKLAHGEYVIPADIVSGLGDGYSDAGAKKLDQMVSNVRKQKSTKGFPPRAHRDAGAYVRSA